MNEAIVAVRELGLLALLLAACVWLGRYLPRALDAWLRLQAQEREKDRQAHLEIQRRMDERAQKFIESVHQVCRYPAPPRQDSQHQ